MVGWMWYIWPMVTIAERGINKYEIRVEICLWAVL